MTFFILMVRENESAEWVADFSRQFPTGQDAQQTARYNNERSARYNWPQRYRVRKVVDTDDDNYISREAAKNLTPLPWKRDSYYDRHYQYQLPHIDPDNPKAVRFFMSIEDAVECRYTSMSMSRFMSRWDAHDDEGRQEILVSIGYYDGKSEFGIARTAEEIVTIYKNGPTSCMNDPEDYDLPEPHPVTVYGTGDLGVAYIKVSDTEYSARAVVYPEKKLYNSMYGHSALLKKYLQDEGYVFDDGRGFDGARIGCISDGGEYLMPYIDMVNYATISSDGKHMILGYSDGDYDVKTTEGYAYYSGREDYEEDYY